MPIHPSVAENGPQTPSTADNRQPVPILSSSDFISQHNDLLSLPLDERVQQLNQRLQASPVTYTNVLDGIALLRAFIPTNDAQTHYALLLRGWTIIGFTAIEFNRPEDTAPLAVYPCETRPLMQAILTANADKLLLATTCTDTNYTFDESEVATVELLTAALEVFGVELLDYLLFYDTMNVSSAWAMYQENGLDNGVTIETLSTLGISGSANLSPING